MSSENSDEQSGYFSTQASNTPGSATPSASETMSTISTLTTSLQISSPVYDNIRQSFQASFTSLGVELSRLEIENKRLAQYNTAIEKELETSNEHNTATEKELKDLREENTELFQARYDAMKKLADVEEENAELSQAKNDAMKKLADVEEENAELSQAKNDAMKKLAEVEEEKDVLQKELDELGELREVLGWKKKRQELETRATEDRERMETSFKGYQQEMEKRVTENQERIQKSIEECQQKMKEHITDVQTQSQNKLEREINRIKADHTLQMQSLTSSMGFQGLEDMTDGYIVREKPFERIPGGMIQVSLAEAIDTSELFDPLPLCEDKNTIFLYLVRDQHQDFKKFTKLAELVFGLEKDHIGYLKGTKSKFMYYQDDDATFISKWTKEAFIRDRLYIPFNEIGNSLSGTVYYVED